MCVSNKDYYSPILCLGAKERTPSSIAFYDMPGKPWKVWAASIFFVPVLAQELKECLRPVPFIKHTRF